MKGKGGCILFLILIGCSILPVCSNFIHSPLYRNSRDLNDHTILSEVAFSTYIGGSMDDTIDCIVVDDSNNTYIAGRTFSQNIPSGGNLRFEYSACSDYYVMKLNSSRGIEYLTYIGGSGYEGSPDLNPIGACSIDVDDLGRVYMTGTTGSSDFPLVHPWQDEQNDISDCFALRLSSDGGSFQYSTFIGGWGLDFGTTIKVDTSYNAYICGWTRSEDFPTMNSIDRSLSGNSDLFLLKLDHNGQLVFSTYVGGSGSETAQGTSSLFLDEARNSYIIGSTTSPDLRITNNAIEYNAPTRDIFFWKVSPNGGFLSGSYFGSIDSDEVGGICVDDLGYIYLTGSTTGTITLNHSIGSNPSAFVAKFTNTGNLLHTTGFGGSGIDYPLGLFVDNDHCVFVTGYTYSPNFPLEDSIDGIYDGLGDCFILKLSSGGDQLLFSSYLGGSAEDIGFTVTATPYHNIMLGGAVNSLDFEIINPLNSTNEDLTGFIIEIEDEWEDIPLTTSTTTTTSTTSPPSSSITTTTLPSDLTDELNSVFLLNSILLAGLGSELIVLFLMVRHIVRNRRLSYS
ncbi:MAG: hypothetical protein JW779_03470 [Candidatus Thorarchaeota archaeon]|nr:hypothetical protein [Candidatus Thorarchaeota archaeon]